MTHPLLPGRRSSAAATGLFLALGYGGLAAQAPTPGIPVPTLAQPSYWFDSAEQHGIRVDVVVRGLAHPFSLALLPNGDALIVERGGALRQVLDATSAEPTLVRQPVAGAPEPGATRGAGLHDLVLHPEFTRNRLVYFTYNRPAAAGSNPAAAGGGRTALTLARARFEDGALVGGEDIFVGDERDSGSGSRIAFDGEGFVYLTTGGPFADVAQRLDSVYGKILRLHDDGRIPADNPFIANPGARGEVFAYGLRDQLGLLVHPQSGVVLSLDHGPNGGDEVNLILPGRNYGWPEYSFGRNYEGPRVSALPVVAGIEQPLVLWIPSIGPTGMLLYTGAALPAWQGNLFVGSARRGEIPGTGGLERIVFNDNLEEIRRESLLGGLHQRIRDVRQGPDGLIYLVTDEDDGTLLRISPAAIADR